MSDAVLIADACPYLTTGELLARAGIRRHELVQLRKENPDIQPAKIVAPKMMIWAPAMVEQIVLIASQRFRRA
jgi:hypothetical protein